MPRVSLAWILLATSFAASLLPITRLVRLVLWITVTHRLTVFGCSDIFLDVDARMAVVGKKRINLTIKEFSLLTCFLENAGTVLSRDTLLENCGMESSDEGIRGVDTHINRLRSKLGEAAYSIKTVRRAGYRFGRAENGE